MIIQIDFKMNVKYFIFIPVGRIVLPTELRRKLDIKEGDPLEIFVDEGQILLKKYTPACIFCGEAKDIVIYESKNICKGCMDELKIL